MSKNINWNELNHLASINWNNPNYIFSELSTASNINTKIDLIPEHLWNDSEFLNNMIDNFILYIPSYVIYQQSCFELIVDKINNLKELNANTANILYVFVTKFIDSNRMKNNLYDNIAKDKTPNFSKFKKIINYFLFKNPHHTHVVNENKNDTLLNQQKINSILSNTHLINYFIEAYDLYFSTRQFLKESANTFYFLHLFPYLSHEQQCDKDMVYRLWKENQRPSFNKSEEVLFNCIPDEFFNQFENIIFMLNHDILDEERLEYVLKHAHFKKEELITLFTSIQKYSFLFNSFKESISKEYWEDSLFVQTVFPIFPQVYPFLNDNDKEKYFSFAMEHSSEPMNFKTDLKNIYQLTNHQAIKNALLHSPQLFIAERTPEKWKMTPDYIVDFITKSDDFSKISSQQWRVIEADLLNLIKHHSKIYFHLPHDLKIVPNLVLLNIQLFRYSEIPDEIWSDPTMCFTALEQLQKPSSILNFENIIQKIPSDFWNNKFIFENFLTKMDNKTILPDVLHYLPSYVKSILIHFEPGQYLYSFRKMLMTYDLQQSLDEKESQNFSRKI